MNSKIIIREESVNDANAIFQLNGNVFETRSEARLVNTLREKQQIVTSLVAEAAGEIVGHILFSPVKSSAGSNIKIAGLAPMAVAKDYQSSGIGGTLIEKGLERCKSLGYEAIVVLGHPKYYPRFGFVPSSDFGIQSEYQVPKEYFMAQELVDNALEKARGVVYYAEAFEEA